MKKIQWLTIVAIFAFASFVQAQDKMLSIDDIFDPQKRVNFSGRPTFVQWNKDGTTYKQVQNQTLMRVNALTGEASAVFDNKKLVTVLTGTTGFTAEEATRLGNAPGQQFNNAETAILINHKNDLYLYNVAGSGSVRRLTNTPQAEEMEADFSPDDKTISFVRGMNLFVVDVATGRETQLTRDGSEKILNGYLDWVYEEELYGRGQKRGYWWSPDSTHIAFLRFDETPVPKFVLPDDTVIDQRVENTDYPQAGDPNPLVKVGAINIRTRSVRFVDTSAYKPEDFLISRVTWSPDSQSIMYQAQNREQTFLDLNAANRATGKSVTAFRETSPAWVSVQDNPVFLKDKTMIWQSERNGFKHLYHYDNNGKMLRQITDGRWEVRDFYGVDEKNGWVYFSATEYDPIGVQIYRVKLDGTGFTRLTKTDGSHSANFNPTFTHFVDNWSDINTPTQTRLYRADGTLEKVLNENRVEALSQYKLGKPEFMRVRTRDGFAMEAMMIKPPNFDPSKKYPVMSYTYSGPQAPSVRNGWGGTRYMWHQMLAQKGYIIWICDNRTASGKGVESAWKGYQNFGVLELSDLEEGLDALRAMPFVDASRIGLWGWSYGGFMTSYAMTHSKSFKAGIAGGTVSDWRLYDSIYTERIMRTPQNNPTGYDRTSVLKAAGNLSGRLLLIHGAMDENVHMQNTTMLAYELQKAGKQFDLMIYPTQRHGIVNPPQVKHMYQMMTDFILKNL